MGLDCQLAGLLTRPRGELGDKVFGSIAQIVCIGGVVSYALVDLTDDGAEHVVLGREAFPQFVGVKVDFREESTETALKRMLFDVLEDILQRSEQITALRVGEFGYVAPEILGVDDVMDAAAHLVFEFVGVLWVKLIPDFQWGLPTE